MSLWDEPNRGRHHLASQISKKHKVIWVNRKLDRTDVSNDFVGIERVNSNLSVLHTGHSFFPDFIPRRIDEIINLNNYFRLKILLNYLKDNFIKPDLIWIYDYKAINVALYYKNVCKTLYYCNDFFGNRAETYEIKLVNLVNSVISTDPRRQKFFSNYNRISHYIPHGSWPITEKAVFKKKLEPETIGYVGTINDTLDSTIFSLILEKTNLRIIIAGPFSECSKEKRIFFSNFFNNARVNYIGFLNKEEIELVIRNIDICLLPYHSKVNGFPLKFFDYLNFGKPIFSTVHDFEWPDNYKKFINFYEPHHDINSFTLNIYQSWNYCFFKEAIFLSENSRWSNRVSEVFDKLNMNR